MDVLLSHTTCLELWRTYRKSLSGCMRERSRASNRAQHILDQAKRTILPESDWLFASCPPPYDFLVSRDFLRLNNKQAKGHVWSGRLPPASFVRVKNGLLLSTPEFLFMQMAPLLSPLQLIVLGMELCGTYACPSRGDTQFDQPPLTSMPQLEAFLKTARGAYGSTRAARVLPFVQPGSASPRETALYLLLCLPYRLGGYGLRRADLNYRLDVPLALRKAGVQKFCKCDLCWPAYNVAVEYDSNQHHATHQAIANDSRRRTLLSAMGLDVITVTNQEILIARHLFATAKLLSRKLSKPLRPESEKFIQAHLALRKTVLS